MPDCWESKGEKIHTRHIEMATYTYDGQRIIVEGVLKEERFLDYQGMSGDTHPPGVFHHMIIRLLVNCSTLLIEDIDVQMPAVPGGEACLETMSSLAPLKGLTITKGFTLKVKKLAGGVKGCTHLVELMQAMAPAVIQGMGIHRSLKPPPFNPERAKKFVQYLANTCNAWRDDGLFVEKITKRIQMEQAKAGHKTEKSR